MAHEKIVAVYDKLGKAKDAMRALEASGFSTSDISLLNRDALTNSDIHDTNLWQRLFGRNVADHESSVYNRTIQSGGAILTLRVPDSEVSRAMQILDVHHPMDMNEKGSSWDMTTPIASSTPASKAVAPPPVVPKTTASAFSKEEVLRLAEEHLDVGKRQVETGKARIRRFVIEEPVESQVTLHEEHAAMLRRTVSEPHLVKDIDWTDKTIEITETDEQAVVSKTARVTEEVVIRKEGSDHVETVRDRVRHQQVEIDRLPRDTKKAA